MEQCQGRRLVTVCTAYQWVWCVVISVPLLHIRCASSGLSNAYASGHSSRNCYTPETCVILKVVMTETFETGILWGKNKLYQRNNGQLHLNMSS